MCVIAHKPHPHHNVCGVDGAGNHHNICLRARGPSQPKSNCNLQLRLQRQEIKSARIHLVMELMLRCPSFNDLVLEVLSSREAELSHSFEICLAERRAILVCDG